MKLRILIAYTLAMLALSAGGALAAGGPIMPLSQVQSGMDCIGKTVVQGTTISSFNVHVIDVVRQAGGEPRILVSVSGPAVAGAGVAEGFSGSPVYCTDSAGTMRNIGAISEGIGQYGNNVALATPIEQMLGEPVLPPSAAPRLTARATPLLGPLTIGGLSPALLGVLQRAGHRDGLSVVPAPGSSFSDFPVQQLVPGASVAASYSTGAISLGAVGTVTYTDGSTVYAFGHELDGAGRRSLLLQDAYVYYVVNNPDPTSASPSYKLTSSGHTVGILTSDTPDAVVGELGAAPDVAPVEVTAHDRDTGNAIELDSQVADETDIGQPLGSSQLDTIAPLEVAQAATQIYNGAPANESGHLCLTVYIREAARPLGFCNRYVGTGVPGDAGPDPPELALSASTDVGTAFQLIDAVQFAKLHVTRVVANVDAQRGLAQGTIVRATAPSRVKPGQRVEVRLHVRLYRGTLKSIRVPIRIPRWAHGRFQAIIHGPATPPLGAAAQALSSVLVVALSGGPAQQPAPASIPALRAAIAGISKYDGLVLRFPGHQLRHLYRDPSLLITGRAVVKFSVGAGR